ncbi:MAG: NUDIX domain-containing protein [Oligoflexia bacterium]|nr:NUDIX domain-containing protein [Oligoflexia bacterium]
MTNYKTFKVQIIVASKNKVLLLRTNKTRGGFWQNITGSVEKVDENLNQAAFREFSEETGLVLSSVSVSTDPDSINFKAKDNSGNITICGTLQKLPFIHNFVDQFNRSIEEHTYLAFLSHIEEKDNYLSINTNDIIIKLDPNEHDQYQWININEIKEVNYKHDSNFKAFKCSLSYLNKHYIPSNI